MSRYRAERAAAKVLDESGSTVPVDVRGIAEDHGVVVALEDLEDNISGVLLAEEQPPIIVVNRKHAPNRRRFSMAHELGHYLLHRNVSTMFIDAAPTFYRDERSAEGVDWQEVEANAFAAALLMPIDALRKLLTEDPIDLLDDAAVKRLAREFRVSSQAMAIRLTMLNLV